MFTLRGCAKMDVRTRAAMATDSVSQTKKAGVSPGLLFDYFKNLTNSRS
jgi:hypothetical protein